MKLRKYLRSSIRIGDLPISNGIDENGIDNEVDSDLRVILRKLSKKDSTTKIRVRSRSNFIITFLSSKAFNELRDYCDANESDEKIRVILPFFVSHYRKWSTVCLLFFGKPSIVRLPRRILINVFVMNVSQHSIRLECV